MLYKHAMEKCENGNNSSSKPLQRTHNLQFYRISFNPPSTVPKVMERKYQKENENSVRKTEHHIVGE
jgi:hypothetical protein